MMRRLLKLRVAVYAVLVASDRSDLNPPDSAWKTLEELCPLLEPFEQATELLTKEDTPTISQIVIIVQQLLRTIQAKSTDQTTTVIRSFKEKICSGLISRFGLDANGSPQEENFNKPMVLATFMDPRYKSLKCFSTEIKERLVGYVSDLLVEVPKAEEPSVKEEVKEEPEDKNSLFDCLAGDVEVDLTGTADDIDDEIKHYQAEPVRIRDPLQWWRSNENRYCVALFLSNFVTITHKILFIELR